MSIASEFKSFAVKGNVMDLAVGVIIGAAFGKIVDSLVNDIIMPVIGRLTGGLDFSNYFVKLSEGPAGIPQTFVELKKAGVALLAYGNFLTVVANFVILALLLRISNDNATQHPAAQERQAPLLEPAGPQPETAPPARRR